jgi:hypothetical protein
VADVRHGRVRIRRQVRIRRPRGPDLRRYLPRRRTQRLRRLSDAEWLTAGSFAPLRGLEAGRLHAAAVRWLSPALGLYWTIVSMSTLGYGDIVFEGDLGLGLQGRIDARVDAQFEPQRAHPEPAEATA